MGSSRTFMKLEIESLSENEAFARVVVAAFAARLDPTLEEISDIKTAVSEAVTNAIIHAYEDKVGLICIRSYLDGNLLTVEVEDWGIGIDDLRKLREPLYTSKPELDRSGMGFTIMENFMMSLASAPPLGRDRGDHGKERSAQEQVRRMGLTMSEERSGELLRRSRRVKLSRRTLFRQMEPLVKAYALRMTGWPGSG